MNVKKGLYAFLFLNLVVLVGVSAWATASENVWQGLLHLIQLRWGVATLCDTYFAFWTITLWICYKENHWAKSLLWFVLVNLLGTIAIAGYILWQLTKVFKKGSVGKDVVALVLLREEGV